MSRQAALPVKDTVIRILARPTARDDERVGWLADHFARNRLIPIPPPDRHFVGDGDFRAIGAEFLRHFVRLGGLRPIDRVVEIGCGIGRMALPLTQYLQQEATGRYDGMDVVADGIAWCTEVITAAYGNFRFHHLDLFNDVYNPAGTLNPAEVTLPFDDGGYDFAILTSVLTHIQVAETRRYIAEIARLLRPGGRCFLSLFLMNDEARTHLRADRRRLPFDPDGEGPAFLVDPAAPSAAVAYDEPFLLDLFAQAGLHLARPVAYGHWCGRTTENYQDLMVLEKVGGAKL
jgi:SAM-dependent methyltransferase